MFTNFVQEEEEKKKRATARAIAAAEARRHGQRPPGMERSSSDREAEMSHIDEAATDDALMETETAADKEELKQTDVMQNTSNDEAWGRGKDLWPSRKTESKRRDLQSKDSFNLDEYDFEGRHRHDDDECTLLIPPLRPPPVGSIRARKDAEINKAIANTIEYFNGCHPEFFDEHSAYCDCIECATDDEVPPLKADSHFKGERNSPEHKEKRPQSDVHQKKEPKMLKTEQNKTATLADIFYKETNWDLPSTSTQAERVLLSTHSEPVLSKPVSSPLPIPHIATMPNEIRRSSTPNASVYACSGKLIVALIRRAARPLSFNPDSPELRIINFVDDYLKEFCQEDHNRAIRLAKQALGAGSFSIRIEADDYQFPPVIQKRELPGEDNNNIYLRPVFIDGCAVQWQFDPRYNVEWPIKTVDAEKSESRRLNMQPFRDLVMLFTLRGHMVKILLPAYYIPITYIYEEIHRDSVAASEELISLVDDIEMFMEFYNRDMIQFLETNESYAIGKCTMNLQSWNSVVKGEVAKVDACLISSYHFERNVNNMNPLFKQQGIFFEKTNDHSLGMSYSDFNCAQKRFLTPIFVSAAKILVMPLTFHNKATTGAGTVYLPNNSGNMRKQDYHAVSIEQMLRYNFSENDEMSKSDYENLVVLHQLPVDRQIELVLLIANQCRLPQLLLRSAQTLLLLAHKLDILSDEHLEHMTD